jgi:hypothetical protein
VSEPQLKNYLASDEELVLSFSAESVTLGGDDTDDNSTWSQDESEYRFGATDRRIVYLDNSGGFKDIGYQHISSIESEIEEDDSDKTAGGVVGCCGGIILLGGLGGISNDPGTGILLILAGVGVLGLGVAIYQNAETTENQKITFITGDEAKQQIEVILTKDADDNIAAGLSSILREQRS